MQDLLILKLITVALAVTFAVVMLAMVLSSNVDHRLVKHTRRVLHLWQTTA